MHNIQQSAQQIAPACLRFDVPQEHRNATGIYRIDNLISHKFYIGSAVCLRKRFNEHFSDLKKGEHHCYKLQDAVNKYGIQNFTFSLVEVCERALLVEREQYWFDTLNVKSKGYNVAHEARNALICSPETNARRSASLRGKHPSTRKIYQFTLEGILVNEWDNSQEAWRKSGFQPSQTTPVATGKRRTAYGYLWSYSDRPNLDNFAKKSTLIKGGKHKDSKAILQYDLQGNLLKEWECASDIQRALNIHASEIGMCAKGKIRYAYGYVWILKKECTKELLAARLEKANNPECIKPKAVCQYTYEGKFVAEWDGLTSLAKAGFRKGDVADCARGIQKTAFGYIWIYKQDLTPEVLQKRILTEDQFSLFRQRRIVQYSLDGIHIASWDNLKHIQKDLGFANKQISSCALGKQKSAHGFIWRYEKA